MNNEFNNQNMISNLENNNSFNDNNLNDKNDKRKDTLILILVIIVFILTALSLYLVIDKKDNDINNDNKNNQQENENNNESINLSEKEIEEYLKHVPYLNGGLVNQADNYDDAYNGHKIDVNDIDKSMLLYNAIMNSSEYVFSQGEEIPLIKNFGNGYDGMQANSYYKESVINNYLKKVYNVNNLNMPREIKVPGGSVILQDGYYLKIMGAGAAKYDKFVYSTNYYLENNNLVIEENTLFYIYNVGDSKCNVYANTSDMHNEINIIDTFNLDYTLADNISLKDYTDKTPTKYKHTYKKVNNEYVWYSTEIIK